MGEKREEEKKEEREKVVQATTVYWYKYIYPCRYKPYFLLTNTTPMDLNPH